MFKMSTQRNHNIPQNDVEASHILFHPPPLLFFHFLWNLTPCGLDQPSFGNSHTWVDLNGPALLLFTRQEKGLN